MTDPLFALGVVILGSEKPVVLCAMDWCEIRAADHVQWRERLAKAAGTTPERVACTAGLIAGSIATIGTGLQARSVSTATTVAVLHATTTASAPSARSVSSRATERAAMNDSGRSPHGAEPESAT